MLHFVIISIAVQVTLFISIFDVYFTSPIIHGIPPVDNKVPTKCSRVVVVSIDGLRFDALLEDNPHTQQKVAPFINQIIKSRGAFGLLRTHLPTESRPGHVAMLAGLYEDPSAITKGWKENPVEFDSIFNRSACSYSWGSPDIVDIFYKGLIHNCSYKWTYNNSQDFAGDTMALDNWVRDEVDSFFHTVNPQAYSQPRTLFFLHLLGQDTSGHTHKPKTERYRENLKNADSIVRHVNNVFARKFADNKTCFVLSSDHGMTDWGSHGGGDLSETETPIVAWGPAIKKYTDKIEIDQADITPLLAILLGVSIPVNSVGLLPVKFLNVSNLVAADAKLLNAQQVCQQYIALQKDMQHKRSFLLYKQYSALEPNSIASIIENIREDIKQGNHIVAVEKIDKLLHLGLDGLKFYQNYFQGPLFFVITLSYIGWISCLLLTLFTLKPVHVPFSVYIASAGLICCAAAAIMKARFPFTYVAYVLLPLFLWLFVIPRALGNKASLNSPLKVYAYSFLFLIGVELLVCGFFYRWIYSICMSFILAWPFYAQIKRNSLLLAVWTLSGVALAFFTLLPVVGKQPNPVLVLLASFFLFALSIVSIYKQQPAKSWVFIGILRSCCVLVAGVNNYYVHSSFSEKDSLTAASQQISWGLLIITPLLLAQSSSSLLYSFFDALITLAVPFILLSISHEVFFFLSLFIHVGCWIKLEMVSSDVFESSIQYRQYLRPKLHDDVSLCDFRQAYFFLTYIVVAFFGIGNIATINSFDPAWVRCFLTTFSPFIMTALILLKVVLPFLVVTLALRVHTLMQGIRPYRIFLIVLIYCNVMALNFFFLVRNEGSWLDIGTSLSHYVIQQVSVLFLLVLFSVAQIIIPNDDYKTAKLLPKSN